MVDGGVGDVGVLDVAVLDRWSQGTPAPPPADASFELPFEETAFLSSASPTRHSTPTSL